MLPTRSTAALLLALGLSGALQTPGAAEAAAAPSDPAGKEEWGDVLEGILAKDGISLGGVFRSQYLHSSIGGDGAVAFRRSEESLEYTSVDFDIRARPNTLTQGRLVFRMHQDWRNFFSDVGNPISSRWISIDGKAGGIFRYNVGDFRQRYSPLTLHSPDISLMYEPEYYAAQRREAMGEAFLGNEERLLQGVNLNLDGSLENSGVTVLREVHLNALGARLRNVETSIGDGSKVTSFIEKSPFEKFLGAANADLGLPFGLSLGGSHLTIFDKKGSYNPVLNPAGNPDTSAQFTTIMAARGGFDLGSALGWNSSSLNLSAEYAMSSDDTAWFGPDTSLQSGTIDGSALLVRLGGGWKGGPGLSFKAGLDFHRNEAGYRNELAQSPTFRGERIMNLENDTSTSRLLDPRASQYTSFDAMYRHAFKFAPSASTNQWHKAPFTKNSYHKSIMTQNELTAFSAARIDTALQLVMPFGPATANRTGLRAELTFGAWEDQVEVKALLASLDEIEGRRIDSTRILPATAFSQMGGGLKLEVGSMFGMAYPLTVSGSLVRSTAENAGIAGDSVFSAHTVESDFINAGLRYQFWKRAALLAAYQEIRTRNVRAVELEEVQKNMGGALEYKVAAGAYATFGLNRVAVAPPAGSVHKEFSQFQTDLYLTVRF
jgi:hypothetical protein